MPLSMVVIYMYLYVYVHIHVRALYVHIHVCVPVVPSSEQDTQRIVNMGLKTDRRWVGLPTLRMTMMCELNCLHTCM